jgi:glycosyltransferase involved in cell wall biosynthesis
MRVMLFGGLDTDRSYSMQRYARSLQTSLAAQFSPNHSFQLTQGRDIRLPFPLSQSRRLQALVTEGWAMQVLYPREARGYQADVNHIIDHSYGMLAGVLPVERTVVTCHDLIPLQVPEIFPTIYSQLTGKRWYKKSVATMMQAGRIIAISDHTKHDLVEYTGCDPEKIAVIPHGIDHRFRQIADKTSLELARQRMNLPASCKFILHVGSSAAYKNIPGLLRVFDKVSRHLGKRVWLLHIGAPLTANQKRLAKRWELEDRIWSIDGPPMEDLVALYNLADVLVFPSLYEGLGLPPIEAMACGLPVVASNVSSLPEVLGGGQLLFPPHAVDEMAEAVISVLKNPALRRELVEKGLRRAKRFSWHLVAREVFSVYEEMLSV